jgi:hypothetical protein
MVHGPEYDISSVKPNSSFGLSEIITDRNNSIWMGTRGDGVIVFNQNGERIRSLTALPTRRKFTKSKSY